MQAGTTGSAAGADAAGERVKLGYRPGLDGLRAVAVFAVLGYHYYHWPGGGQSGVDLFFVLSGFLITTLLVEEWRERDQISLSRFYRRRALRLLPALWFFLVVWMALSLLTGHFVLGPYLYGVTYTTNIAQAVQQVPGAVGLPDLGHLWSLANEEQFYLLWPLLLIVMLRRRWRPLRIATVAATLALAEVVAHDVLDHGRLDFFRFDAMLIGCAGGILFASPLHGKLRRFCCAAPVAAAGAILVSYLLIRPPTWSFPIGGLSARPVNLVFALSAIVTIVWVVEGCPGFRPAHWALAAPPVAFLGRISYALYLWHEAVVKWLSWPNGGNVQSGRWLAPLGIVCTIAVASVSYWFVERRFLRAKWRLSTTGSHDADVSGVLRTHRPELSRAGEPLFRSFFVASAAVVAALVVFVPQTAWIPYSPFTVVGVNANVSMNWVIHHTNARPKQAASPFGIKTDEIAAGAGADYGTSGWIEPTGTPGGSACLALVAVVAGSSTRGRMVHECVPLAAGWNRLSALRLRTAAPSQVFAQITVRRNAGGFEARPLTVSQIGR